MRTDVAPRAVTREKGRHTRLLLDRSHRVLATGRNEDTLLGVNGTSQASVALLLVRQACRAERNISPETLLTLPVGGACTLMVSVGIV